MTYRGNANLFRIDKFFPYKSIWEVAKRTNQLDFTAQDILLETVLRQLLERRGFFIPSLLIFRFHNEIFIKLFFIKIKGYQKYILRKRSRDLDYRYRKANKARYKFTNLLKKTQTLLLLDIIHNNIIYKKYVHTFLYKFKSLQKQLKKYNKITNKEQNFTSTELFLINKYRVLTFLKNKKFNKKNIKNLILLKKIIVKKKVQDSKIRSSLLFFTKKIKIKQIKNKKTLQLSYNLFKRQKDITNLKLLTIYIGPLLSDLKSLILLKKIDQKKEKNILLFQNLSKKYSKEYHYKNFFLYLMLLKNKKDISFQEKIISFYNIIKTSQNKNLLNLFNCILKKYNFLNKFSIIKSKINLSKIQSSSFLSNYYIKLLLNKNLILQNIKKHETKININKLIYKTLFLCIIITKHIYNKNWFLLIQKLKKTIKLPFEQLLSNYCGVPKLRIQYYNLKPLLLPLTQVYAQTYINLTFFEKNIFNYFFQKKNNLIITKKNFLFFNLWLKKIELTLMTKRNSLKLSNLLNFRNNILLHLKKRILLQTLFQNTKFNKYRNEPYYKDLLKIFAYLFFNKKASTYLLIRFISFQFRILNRKKQRKFLTFIKRICEHFEIHPLLKAQFALKLRIKGRIGGKPRKKVFTIQTSKLFLTEVDNLIEANTLQAYSRYGSYGISLWLRRTDLFSNYTKQIGFKTTLPYKHF